MQKRKKHPNAVVKVISNHNEEVINLVSFLSTHSACVFLGGELLKLYKSKSEKLSLVLKKLSIIFIYFNFLQTLRTTLAFTHASSKENKTVM